MTSKPQYQQQWQVTHIKRYPTAPVKRIYCRKILVPIVKQTKGQATLAKILED